MCEENKKSRDVATPAIVQYVDLKRRLRSSFYRTSDLLFHQHHFPCDGLFPCGQTIEIDAAGKG